jgi:hypothetical protein
MEAMLLLYNNTITKIQKQLHCSFHARTMLMNSQPTKRCFLSYADGHTDRRGALAAGEDSSVDFMQQQQW